MNKSILFKALEGFGLLWKSISLLLLASVILANTSHAEVDFDYLHGSDLGMGIGARAVSMGGPSRLLPMMPQPCFGIQLDCLN